MGAIVPIPPPSPAFRAVVGVSGGRDSVALLHALAEGGWRNLLVAHLDHALRAESAADAEWVRRLAERRGFEAMVEREDVARRAAETRQSIETAARAARLAFFARALRRWESDTLFLAHHADDQAETFLFRVLRGSGVGGLGAMRPEMEHEIDGRRVRIVRPFLGVWRAEIDAWIAAQALSFREDSSNADPRPTRNRLRHEILPAIEAALGRDVRRALWRAAEIARAEDDCLAASPPLRGPLPTELSAAELRAEPLALQRRIIHRWLRERSVADVGFAEVEAVRGLLTARAPAKVNLPGGRHARRRAGKVFVEPA